MRFDANYDDTSPDKAEFFYAKCGCFANSRKRRGSHCLTHGPAVQNTRSGSSGVSQFSGQPSLNYQEVATYLEYAPTLRFSGFIELPARFIQPVRSARVPPASPT